MDVLEHLIARAGQTQESRPPEGLAPGFVQVEGHTSLALYQYARSLAGQVRFHYAAGGAIASDLDWAPFFPEDGLPGTREGGAPPHLALFAAFLKLHRIPRAAMNGITARHLEFFYRRVLGFAPRAARPDRAHLVLELKKNAPNTEIGPQHAFSAGKDDGGVELLYAPLDTTVLNHGKVKALHTVHVDPADGTVRFAPVADSADGLGTPLEGAAPRWRAFGHQELPAAPVGFALASPVLRMKEGVRKVSVELELDGLTDELAAALDKRFQAFVTAPKRWLGPYTAVDTTRDGNRVAFSFTVPAAEEAVADYDPARHGMSFATRLPVVQLLLTPAPAHGYPLLQRLVVVSARVAVEVSGVKSLQLENEAGLVDARKPFQPFGAQPANGARFMVGYPEALAKDLERLTLELHWRGLPNFADRYKGYNTPLPKEEDFKAHIALRDGAGHETAAKDEHALFRPREGNVRRIELAGADLSKAGSPLASAARRLHHLAAGGSRLLALAAQRERYRLPMFRFDPGPPAARPGFITLQLEGDFRHAEYRSKLLSGKAVPDHEPYTPMLSEISLSYRAVSREAQIDSDRESAFGAADVELFHVGAFGQRREHGWLRAQLDFVAGKRVPLVPEYEDEGELLAGLEGIAGGDSASLLFQAAEGSADPEVDPAPEVRWSVLCDNYWKPLAGREAVRDGTNGLLATGIVHLVIPPQASALNSFLPAGLVWVRASIRKDVHGVCSLVSVAANAIEVERRAGETKGLPAGRIAKLKTPLAAVKGVAQPFAGFGGMPLETGFDTRVAERLRHRARCISAWDYERSVLEAFPELRKVKCIPHCAGAGAWLDPGHVTLVVVPDLRKRPAYDRLQPRVDAGMLKRIHDHVVRRAPMGIGVHARNPRYQRVRFDFKVAFRAGFEFNFYAAQLREEIVAHLSPWAQDPGRAIAFGGLVYKSEVLDFIEERPYVDYLTDFRMYHLRGGAQDTEDVNEARAATPDAILVSDETHDIAPVPG